MILIVCFILMFVLLAWAVCHAQPNRNDAEQLEFLEQWRRKHDHNGRPDQSL